MFGKGASEDQAATKRFDELKGKYQTALSVIDQQGIQLQNLHVEDNKLFIRGNAPSQSAANEVWDQVKLVNPSLDDISLNLSVTESQAAAATAQSSQSGSTRQSNLHGEVRRHALENQSPILRKRERVHANLLCESRQTARP